MVCTRSDIAQAVGVVSRYMSNLGKEHWRAVKWILRYLKGSSNMILCYDGTDVSLHEYVDSDFVSDKDNRRSTAGYVFTLGNIALSWMSRLQKITALSIMKAKYVAVIETYKELIRLKDFIKELGK